MAYRKSETTRNAILAASRRLFAEKGYYNTDIKEIAAELGMAHTAIYYYFKGKADILSELYDEETSRIIHDVNRAREEHNFSELFLCILHYVLLAQRLAFNPVTADYFFDMVSYRQYSMEEMQRVRTSYYAPLDNLFRSRGVSMSDDEMTLYILTSDAYAKALLSALKSGITGYSFSGSLDYFFRHLLLPDLNISFEEYAATRDRVFSFLQEGTR